MATPTRGRLNNPMGYTVPNGLPTLAQFSGHVYTRLPPLKTWR